jgi:tetratricopeptide (TPR) repeat protein
MTTETERADDIKVEHALDALSKGDVAHAEALLRDVVSRTPADYRNEYDRDGQHVIKFWSQNDFVYFCTRKRAEPLKQSIIWEHNVYPRAFYHLGFICVKQGKPEDAIRWLEAGCKLDAHPMFWLERGKALTMLKRLDEAFALYDHIASSGDETPASIRAIAMRGKGFVLIEKSELDSAAEAFRLSLTLDPDSGVARNELAYIAQLRAGGNRGSVQSVALEMNSQLTCLRCGTKELDGAKVATVQGRLVALCKSCHRKITKKWWEFWK